MKRICFINYKPYIGLVSAERNRVFLFSMQLSRSVVLECRILERMLMRSKDNMKKALTVRYDSRGRFDHRCRTRWYSRAFPV